jgi:hypothetical protein
MISKLHSLGRVDKRVDCYVVADDVAIYGVGNTETEAIADYQHWARESYLFGGAKVMPATPSLIEQVLDEGGCIAWDVKDGVARTVDESEEDDP